MATKCTYRVLRIAIFNQGNNLVPFFYVKSFADTEWLCIFM